MGKDLQSLPSLPIVMAIDRITIRREEAAAGPLFWLLDERQSDLNIVIGCFDDLEEAIEQLRWRAGLTS